jgi:hypothetical protein
MLSHQSFKIFTVLLFAVFFAKSSLYGQSITNYAFGFNTTGFTPLSTPTAGPNFTGSTNEGVFNNIPIGFEFYYMGKRYTEVSASTNGWFSFGNALSAASPTNSLTSGGTPRPVIAPLWDDLDIISANNFSYKLTGTAPSRTLTLEWKNVKWSRTAGSGNMSFQAIIKETTGVIQFLYLTGVNATSASASAGLSSSVQGSTNFLSMNGFGTYILLSGLTTNAPTVSNTSEVSSISGTTAPILSGVYNFFTFTPPQTPPTAPTNLTFSNIATASLTLNWTDNSNNEAGFPVYRSTDNLTFNYVGQAAANANTFDDSGLVPGTIYYYRVFAVSEGVLSTALLGNKRTLNCPAPYPAGITSNYKLDGNAKDETGLNNGAFQNSPTSTADRFTNASSAYSFNGTTQYMSTSTSYSAPVQFTISTWFKTTTANGGVLVGFGDAQTGQSGTHDRHIYMGQNGRIYFGVYTGVVKTLGSASAYNDGNWHQATGVLSATTGMKFFIDGVQVGSDPAVTSAINYSGYWRVGFDRMENGWTGWTGGTTSAYFNGTLDDVLIYHSPLSDTQILGLYEYPVSASNTGPVCAGSTVNLRAMDGLGATYSWIGPAGFTSNAQNPSFTFVASKAGSYTVTVTTAGGCSANASTTISANTTSPGLWSGKTDADWSNVNNWCDCVLPTSSVDVSIPTTGPTYYPTLTTTGSVKNIALQNATSLKIYNDGNLQVAGSITNNGIINSIYGGVTFNGALAQVIPANVFVANTLKSLTINNVAGVTLQGNLRLKAMLTANAGVFNAGNNLLTLASSADTTAQLASVPSGASVQGNVIVERFIKGGAQNPYRTYRMLSSPVYDAPATFETSGARTYGIGQFIDDIIVTGAGGVSNGFDASTLNNATAFTYTNTGYLAVPNASTAVDVGKGVHVFYRGDRLNNFATKIQADNANWPNPENTVMTFKGILNQQDVVVPLSYSTATNGKIGFNLLGNPYASTIDWGSPNWSKTNIDNKIWIWNPNMRQYAVWDGEQNTNGGTQYISSGQSFFVKANATNPSITFKEGVKASAQQFLAGNLLMQPPDQKIGLAKAEGKIMATGHSKNLFSFSLIRIKMNNPASYHQDEAVVVLNENSDPIYNDEDAIHFDGEGVFMSTLSKDNVSLSINYMPGISAFKEVKLNVNATLSGNYALTFNLENIPNGYLLLLKDSLLNTSTPVNNEMTQSFNIDKSNALSFAPGRFKLVLEPIITLLVNMLSFKGNKDHQAIKLKWVAKNPVNHNHFYVQKSKGLPLFSGADELRNVAILGDGNFELVDNNPLPGENYYKLVEVDNNGNQTFSKLIAVRFDLQSDQINTVFPNPFVDSFTVKYTGELTANEYVIIIFDSLGKMMIENKITKQNLINGYLVDGNALQNGMYFVSVIEANSGKQVLSSKMIK